MNIEEQIKKAEKMRSEWATSDAKRDEGLQPLDEVRVIRDIPYTFSKNKEEEPWHLMDLYYPAEVDITNEQSSDVLPVIVSVHGGGWFYGDKELYSHYCMKLASYGFAVIDFNYRLSPVYKYPAGFMDVCDLFGFLSINADKYSLDMDRLFALGDSAGAQLLSQYCIFATNSDYRSLFDFVEDPIVPVPKRIALNCGVYEMKDMVGRDELMELYLDEDIFNKKQDDNGKLSDLANSFYNILDYMNPSFPETYLMLSVNDDLKIHTYPMKDKLSENGINFVFREFGEDNLLDGHVFHVNMRSENGKKCNDEEISFFIR